VLRGLDYLRAAGAAPDDRVAEAIELVRSKRDADGRWPLENPQPQLSIEDGLHGVSLPHAACRQPPSVVRAGSIAVWKF
jgi:hypothetical protein